MAILGQSAKLNVCQSVFCYLIAKLNVRQMYHLYGITFTGFSPAYIIHMCACPQACNPQVNLVPMLQLYVVIFHCIEENSRKHLATGRVTL